MSTPVLVGLDFETRGSKDLPKVGLDNYIKDPLFAPIVACFNTVGFREDFDLTVPAQMQKFKDTFWDLYTGNYRLCAHNARFERMVLRSLGLPHGYADVLDTAVLARMAGASSSLMNSSRQLTDTPKLETGSALIKLFSIPDKEGNFLLDRKDQWDAETWAKWQLFIDYCQQDARACRKVAEYCYDSLPLRAIERELRLGKLTDDMNELGWPVDLRLVDMMDAQANLNKQHALNHFYQMTGESELNLGSTPQLIKWCKQRGIKATSFDETHVAKMLGNVERKLASGTLPPAREVDYREVHLLLSTKQILGGASLKKLPVIRERTGPDSRLREQYLHVGAGQSFRTTGVGVQMQNLPRLSQGATDVGLLAHETWSNAMLSANLRQCFTASDPAGLLLVGDFSSIESRGLAYTAGEQWKQDAYNNGQDLYKLLAAKIYNTSYDLVGTAQRQTGKVGELSCGYGAGGEAVQAFAEKMGVDMSLEEATSLVQDWRTANPAVVAMWQQLNDALLAVLTTHSSRIVKLAHGMSVAFLPCSTPDSLLNQHQGVQSIRMHLYRGNDSVLYRDFHGCYLRGREMCYYKPSDNQGGKLWSATFRNPKTKQLQFHKLYGGKLTGILIQSFCRELFFNAVQRCARICSGLGTDLIGQFHDELVFDWKPGGLAVEHTKKVIANRMTDDPLFPDFPLAVKINQHYRYIK